MFYQPSQGHGLAHNPFKALVAPRPIGWISTLSGDGRPNLAPYSYFNALSDRPPMVMFSADDGKDSAANARRNGEFVVNIVGAEFTDKMVLSSADLPPGESEFEFTRLTPQSSNLVQPPRIAGIPAALECVVTEIIHPKKRDGSPASCEVVFGEVIGVYIDEEYIVDGRFDIVKSGTVGRLGYRDYVRIESVFTRDRPPAGMRSAAKLKS